MNIDIHKIIMLLLFLLSISFVYWLYWTTINNWLSTIVNWVNQYVLIYIDTPALLLIILLFVWLPIKYFYKNYKENK